MSAAVAAAAPALQVTLEARDLMHRYGPRVGLERMSFSVGAPSLVAVTGPNGSGKSTLLRIVAGLLRASHGAHTLAVEGRTLAPAARRDHVGYVAPDLAFYEELTAAENLRFAAEARGLQTPGSAVAIALDRVGLGARASDRAGALSSGMKQRLRLAFALLHRPRVLLLDEPESHLDDDGRALMAAVVAEQRRHGLVMIATHDQGEARLADQRIELRGRGLGHPA